MNQHLESPFSCLVDVDWKSQWERIVCIGNPVTPLKGLYSIGEMLPSCEGETSRKRIFLRSAADFTMFERNNRNLSSTYTPAHPRVLLALAEQYSETFMQASGNGSMLIFSPCKISLSIERKTESKYSANGYRYFGIRFTADGYGPMVQFMVNAWPDNAWFVFDS